MKSNFRELDTEIKNSISIVRIEVYFTVVGIDYGLEKHECMWFSGDSIWWRKKGSSHSERLGTVGLWLSEEGGRELQHPSLHRRDYPTSHPENQRVSGTFSGFYCMYVYISMVTSSCQYFLCVCVCVCEQAVFCRFASFC